MENKPQEETVLCVHRDDFEDLGSFQGINLNVPRYLGMIGGQDSELGFVPRADAEKDPTFKQIIPYHVLVRPTEHGDPQVLEYIRTKQSGEQRLATKRSVGIGGHINFDDAQGAFAGTLAGSQAWVDTTPLEWANCYRLGASRELSEEVELAAGNKIQHRIAGYINDESTEVGKVHFGVIHLVQIPNAGGLYSMDPALEIVGFRSPDAILRHYNAVELEGWAKLVMEKFHKILENPLAVDYPFFNV